jgi:phasin family protein
MASTYKGITMNAIPQQLFTAQKSGLDTILAIQGAFFSGFEKLAELNMTVVRSTLDEVAERSQQAVDVKDPQEALAFSSAFVQGSPEKALAYGKHVFDIFSSVQADLSKLSEEQLALRQLQINEALDQLAKNAPTGSEGAVALLKTSVATASNAYESAVKAVRQVTDAAETNISAATNAGFKAAADAAEVGKATRTRRAA